MNIVKVLIEGYAREIEDGWIASSSVTLVKSNGKNIIVDPGCNRVKLIEELAKEGLKTGDIGYVYLTHNHTDHILLTAIFENAKVLNEEEIYDGDKQIEHEGKIPGTDLKIIQTPGHDQFHSALVVPVEDKTYVVAGDVFWWKDDEEKKTDRESLLAHADPYVKDAEVLTKSRATVLEISDYVIPGHGKIFEVEK